MKSSHFRLHTLIVPLTLILSSSLKTFSRLLNKPFPFYSLLLLPSVNSNYHPRLSTIQSSKYLAIIYPKILPPLLLLLNSALALSLVFLNQSETSATFLFYSFSFSSLSVTIVMNNVYRDPSYSSYTPPFTSTNIFVTSPLYAQPHKPFIQHTLLVPCTIDPNKDYRIIRKGFKHPPPALRNRPSTY